MKAAAVLIAFLMLSTSLPMAAGATTSSSSSSTSSCRTVAMIPEQLEISFVPGSTYWYSMALDVELWNNSTQTQAVQINMSQYSRLAGSGYGGYPNGYHSWWFWNVSVPYPSGVVGPYYYPPKTVLGVQWPELPVPDLSVPESGPFTHSYVNGWDTYQSAQIYLNGKPDGPKYTWTVIGPDDYGSPVLTPPPPCQKPPAVSYYLIILVLAITFTFLLAAKRPKTGPQ